MKIAAELRLKHGELYLACKRHGGVKAFAEKLGIGHQTVHAWLHMRRCPVPGKYTYWFTPEIESRLVELTGKSVAELFPQELREALPELKKKPVHVLIKDVPAAVLISHCEAAKERLTLRDPAQEVEEVEDRDALRAKIDDAMRFFTPRERQILKLRFGIDCEPMTLEEVGHVFQVTNNRVRQIEQRALRRLQSKADEFLGEFKPQLPPNFELLDAEFTSRQKASLADIVMRDRK